MCSRVLVITDTHGIFLPIYEKNKDKIGRVSMLILLGDHSVADVARIKQIFDSTVIMKYGLYGNHDVPDTLADIPCLDHKPCRLGFTFTGLNGSHRYKPTQVFGYDQEEGIKATKTLPKVSVLFSHDSPFRDNQDDAHCGLKGITKYIKKAHPKTVIHGHLHKPDHYQIKSFGRTTDVYCVYQMAVFEIEKDGTVKSFEQFDTL